MKSPHGSARYLGTREIALDDLDELPGNPRRGDVEAIRESVRRFGQAHALVVRECDPDAGRARRVVLAGNHTSRALRLEGYAKARCELYEVKDDVEADRLAAALNRLGERGDYDDVALARVLHSFGGDFAGTGWEPEDLQTLMMDDPPPGDFRDLDGLETKYECPSCHYEWSGSPRPGAREAAEAMGAGG